MALLVFIASSGFMLNKHYCQEELKSVAIYQKARNCHELLGNGKTMSCPMHQAMAAASDSQEKKKCCSEASDWVQLDIDQQLTFFAYPRLNTTTVAWVLPAILQLKISAQPNLDYRHYRPPLIVYDRLVDLQTFLI